MPAWTQDPATLGQRRRPRIGAHQIDAIEAEQHDVERCILVRHRPGVDDVEAQAMPDDQVTEPLATGPHHRLRVVGPHIALAAVREFHRRAATTDTEVQQIAVRQGRTDGRVEDDPLGNLQVRLLRIAAHDLGRTIELLPPGDGAGLGHGILLKLMML